MRVGCGHATAYGHPQLAAGSSYELVPSGDPFICCLGETFFVRFFLTELFFISSEKQNKFVTSTTATAVQSKSDSHVNVYYQPVEFTSFCLVCSLWCF
jgi:hypothetical protein